MLSYLLRVRVGAAGTRQTIARYPVPGSKGRCSVDITKLVLSIIDVAACLFLIAVVLLQSGKSAGLSGAIAGVADTFMAKNKAKKIGRAHV